MSLLSKLAGWLTKLAREVNFANAVMRVPKMRVRHSGPARGGHYGPPSLDDEKR